MIYLDNVTKAFGDNIVLDNVSWSINPSEKIGLIGHNGAGKTTVFRIIRGQIAVDKGEVHIKKNISIGHLPQYVKLSTDKTVIDEVLSSFKYPDEVERKLNKIEIEMENYEENNPYYDHLLKKYGRLREYIDDFDIGKIKSKAEKILAGLGFERPEFKKAVTNLSKGWQMKVAIAHLLMQDNDVLLLDEPTNHLDLNSIEWLENYLKDFKGAFVIISHDKYLLNRTTKKLVEIESGVLREFYGNYDRYLEEKEKLVSDRQKKYEQQQKEIEKIKNFIDKNRSRKDRAKVVQSRIKYLENLERIEPLKTDRKEVRFKFPERERSGRIALQINNLTHYFDENVILENINLKLERGEKIGLIGNNGAGKTTLLKIIAGMLKPSEGEIRLGHHIEFQTYIEEDKTKVSTGNTVFEEMEQNTAIADFPYLRDILGAFLFRGDEVFKKVNILSGGEKCRLALAKMMVKPSNMLILDEPTDHLDARTQTILEKAFKEYSGTVIFVSHDRAFIDKIADKIIEIEHKKIKEYYGNYSYYIFKKSQSKGRSPSLSRKKKEKKDENPEKIKKRTEAEDRKQVSEIKTKITEIENLIRKDEERKKVLSELLGYSGLYKVGNDACERINEYKEIDQRLKDLYKKWEELVSSLPE